MTVTPSAREQFDQARGLLVDLDGTLVDSSGPVDRVWSAFARRHGLHSAEVRRYAQGRPSRETVRALAPEPAHAREERMIEEAECIDTAGTLALVGAAELLAGGRRLAIVTSCSARLAHVRLRAAGLRAPEVLISADDVRRGKPDPECFVLGARALGLDPSQCVVLEDSPAGVTAGLAAGAAVIALRGTHSDAELALAGSLVTDLTELVGPVQTPGESPRAP